MKKENIKGILAMTVVVIIYGVSYISREVVSQYLNTGVMAAFSITIMAVLLTLYNLVKKNKLTVLRKKDIPWIIASGLSGIVLCQGFTNLSVVYIGGTVASLLYGFAAVFALITELLFLHRKKTRLGMISIGLSLIGVYILMGVKLSDLAAVNYKGYLLSFLGIVSWVVYCFLTDRISEEYETTVLLNYQAVVGMVTMLPFFFVFPVKGAVLAKPEVLLNLILLGVFNSTLGCFLNIYAIQRIGVTLSNLIMDFMPVVTIVAALLVYGTMPDANQIIGGGIILVSVFLLNQDQRNMSQEEAVRE